MKILRRQIIWPAGYQPADPSVVPIPAPSRPADPPEPTVLELAANFTGAVAHWIARGAPVVSADEYEARAAACGACELWDAEARAGLGKCLAPGCGCTKFKRWLATEHCPHPKGSRWPENSATKN